MNSTHPALRLGSLLALSATTTSAQFASLDDFSDSSRNIAKWGTPIIENSGLFSMSGDGVVRHSSSGGAATENFVAWPWIVGDAPFDKNWSIQADVNVPVIPLPPGNTANGIGIAVRNTADPNDNFGSFLENFRTTSSPDQSHHFFSSLDINGDNTEEIFSSTTSVSAAVRISWDAATQTLTASFDADGAVGGYEWTPFRSVEPALPTTWNMTASDKFEILLVGYAEEVDISLANNVFADNFYAIGTDLPQVGISRVGDNIKLTWSRLALGYSLKSSSSLTDPWSPVTEPVTVVGDDYEVTLPLSAAPKRFFRLEN